MRHAFLPFPLSEIAPYATNKPCDNFAKNDNFCQSVTWTTPIFVKSEIFTFDYFTLTIGPRNLDQNILNMHYPSKMFKKALVSLHR